MPTISPGPRRSVAESFGVEPDARMAEVARKHWIDPVAGAAMGYSTFAVAAVRTADR